MQSPGLQAQAGVRIATFNYVCSTFHHLNIKLYIYQRDHDRLSRGTLLGNSDIDGKQRQYDFEFKRPEARYFSAGGSSTMSRRSLIMNTSIPYKDVENG